MYMVLFVAELFNKYVGMSFWTTCITAAVNCVLGAWHFAWKLGIDFSLCCLRCECVCVCVCVCVCACVCVCVCVWMYIVCYW